MTHLILRIGRQDLLLSMGLSHETEAILRYGLISIGISSSFPSTLPSSRQHVQAITPGCIFYWWRSRHVYYVVTV